MSEELVLQKICLAWNSLDVSIIEPYLDSKLHYHSFYVNDCFYSKGEYISYISRKFEKLSKSAIEKVKAEIVDENGVSRVCLHSENKYDILEVSIADGLIQKMLLRPPYRRFLFENFDKDYQELITIAETSLKDYVNGDKLHNWHWIKDGAQRKGFCDICLAYDDKVLNIVVGLFRKNIEGVNEYCIHKEFDNLLYECKNEGRIPCLFLIDSIGQPVKEGCHIIDARTFDSLVLEPLNEDFCEFVNDKISVF